MPTLLSNTKQNTLHLFLACIITLMFCLGAAQGQNNAASTAVQIIGGSQVKIDNHVAKYGEHGQLLPWTSWGDAIDREMQWYQRGPWDNGYPRFVTLTFMTGDYQATSRTDTIPAMQNGMGIISYLKYYHWKKESDPGTLKIARAMGDFLVKE